MKMMFAAVACLACFSVFAQDSEVSVEAVESTANVDVAMDVETTSESVSSEDCSGCTSSDDVVSNDAAEFSADDSGE